MLCFGLDLEKGVMITSMTYKGTNTEEMQNIQNLNYYCYYCAIQKYLYLSPH